MRSVLILLGLGLLTIGGFWTLKSYASPQHSPEFEAFLQQVDVDGDCINTAGDRAVVEWWCENGGDFETIEAAAIIEEGVCNVQAFLESPAAQLP